MTIINQESREVLVEDVKVSSENLFLSIEHILLSNEIEAQPISFLKVPDSCKKILLSKDWYWNGAKLVIQKN
ncbi:hypothetical protein [uncultured Helicobacter sp.]|uniref:hypothetical protein n=1 Tax=uncultured Helicobacter sp. TaxID=175537 RepID=UPI00260DF329|nr:hypothetical protein [uncultured Helicobacter sp.]